MNIAKLFVATKFEINFLDNVFFLSLLMSSLVEKSPIEMTNIILYNIMIKCKILYGHGILFAANF